MFTFIFLYVFFYLWIFLSLLLLTFVQLPIQFLTSYSTAVYVTILQKYIPSKNLFFCLIFCLTGLPPVGLFFVKFNILIILFYQAHIFTIMITFLFFLFNMLYYIQLFNFKNNKLPVYNILNPQIMENWTHNYLAKSWITSYNSYKLVLSVINILLFLFLSLFFFNDYFLIISLI